MTQESPVIDANSSESTVKEKETVNNIEKKAPSPAADLRDIQALLVSGVYQGNMAPAVVKAYQLLEKMALTVEAQTAAQETK